MSPSVSVRLLLTQSDERLMGYARAGHERAFEALVERYRRQLHRYCRRLLLSDERAEDALQQALLQAWVALRDGAEVYNVRPWLYRIVHNAAVNALRVSGYDYCTLNESLSGADAPQSDLDRRIAVREALAGLAALPEMQREALLRTAVEGHSHQQVASDLGLSEPAVRGLVYRARTALRAAAGAIVPPPLLSWALEAGTRGTPALESVAGVGASGSAVGLASLLVKGSAVAVTAGALAGGIVAAHGHKAHVRAAAAQASAQRTNASRPPLTASTYGQAVAFTQLSGTRRHPAFAGDQGSKRSTGQPNGRRFRTHVKAPRSLSPALSPTNPSSSDNHAGESTSQQADWTPLPAGEHEDRHYRDSSSHDGHGHRFASLNPAAGARKQRDGGGNASRHGGRNSGQNSSVNASRDGSGGGGDTPNQGSNDVGSATNQSSGGSTGSGHGSSTGSSGQASNDSESDSGEGRSGPSHSATETREGAKNSQPNDSLSGGDSTSSNTPRDEPGSGENGTDANAVQRTPQR